ncbi:MAG: tetratricopeptide repeat protein [Gammaproteobacteria bacterium]|nr:tetratricopeptide repeat protein [Gammaproteobacteria bacterium]
MRLRHTLSWILPALLYAGAILADQTDTELDTLFADLKSAATLAEARVAEDRIWAHWARSGDQAVDELYAAGISAMREGRLDEAIRVFSKVIAAKPKFAEGWNKRATLYFYADRFDESVSDIRAVLALEPRHFGAISGMGLVFLVQKDYAGALLAFEQVLAINPQSLFARAQVERLREVLKRGPV